MASKATKHVAAPPPPPKPVAASAEDGGEEELQEAPVLVVDPAALEESRLANFKSPKVDKEDDLRYDLGNLLAQDVQPLDLSLFKQNPEAYLLEHNRENVQLLFTHIFDLPADEEAVATLPPGTTKLPRAKPVPKEKAKTRWEEFRLQKGLAHKKRERMLWDEKTGKYRPRWGKDRASNEEEWAVPAKANEDPTVDPFLSMKKGKQERIAKNKSNQMRNLKLASGKANSVHPMIGKAPVLSQSKEKLKADLDAALNVARTSSASVGKFDKTLPNEKPMRVKRKYEPVVGSKDGEKSKNMKVLDRLFAGKEQLLDVGKAVSQHNKEQRKQKGKGRGGDRDGGKWKKGGKGKALNSKSRGGPSPKRA